MRGGGRKRPAWGAAEAQQGRRSGGSPGGTSQGGRRDNRPPFPIVPWRHGGSGNGGGTGGPYRAPPPYRAPAAGAPSVATEGGAVEMETAGTAGDLGDGRGG